MQCVTAVLSPLPHLLFFLFLLLAVTQCEVYHLADRSSDTMGMVVETTQARARVMSETVMRWRGVVIVGCMSCQRMRDKISTARRANVCQMMIAVMMIRSSIV